MSFLSFDGRVETAYFYFYAITGIIFCVVFAVAIALAATYKREWFYNGSMWLLFLGNFLSAL